MTPWTPGQNTGAGSLSLLQENLPNPGIKPQVSQITGGTAGTVQAYLSMRVSLLIKRTSLHEKRLIKVLWLISSNEMDETGADYTE